MIKRKFPVQLLISSVTPEAVGAVFDCELCYDPDSNPLAVTAVFSTVYDQTEWRFARDLMYRGLEARGAFKAGDGDVKFRAQPFRQLLIGCFTSPDGHADVGMPEAPVREFLNATVIACPFGSERADTGVDDLLKEIFE